MRKILLILCAAMLILITATGCRKDSSSAAEYVQETAEDGIAYDLSGNPYFMEKISGYDYPEPERITYYSDITDTNRHARVMLPDGYDEDETYPVLYLLHGLGGSDKTWINKNADIIVHNLHYLNDAPEMIVVFVNCNVNEEESVEDLEWGGAVEAFDRTGEDLINNLMPYIEEHYSVKTDKNNTAIAGYSLGGRESAIIAFTYQDEFGYVGAFSTVSPFNDTYLVAQGSDMGLSELTINEGSDGFRLIMLNTGDEDPYIQGVHNFHDKLTEAGIEHIYFEVAGKHENSVWQNALYNFGLRIFRD